MQCRSISQKISSQQMPVFVIHGLYIVIPKMALLYSKTEEAHSNAYSTVQLWPGLVSDSVQHCLNYTPAKFQPSLCNYCRAILKMVALCPKQAKGALKYLLQYLQYGKSALITLYNVTTAIHIPNYSCLYRVSVMLLTKYSSFTQNLKKAHSKYCSLHLNLFQGKYTGMHGNGRGMPMQNILWIHEVPMILFIKQCENCEFVYSHKHAISNSVGLNGSKIPKKCVLLLRHLMKHIDPHFEYESPFISLYSYLN